MKTKIKILLLLSLFCLPFSVEANWYQCGTLGCAPTVDFTVAISNCVADAYPDAIWPTIPGTGPSGDTGFIYANGQTQVLGSGQCEWWDSTAPIASSLTYANAATAGWQNSTNIILNWTESDPGGSGVKNYDIRVYQVLGAQGVPGVLVSTFTTPTAGTSYIYAGIDGYAYKFEICPQDYAGNVCSSWTTSTDIARVDTIPPDPINLINTNPTSLLATTTQVFTLTFNDGGAPVSIRSNFEDFANPFGWIPVFNPSAFAFAHSTSQNISKVDSDRVADGGTARGYTYRVPEICDQAGNCWSGIQDYNYNVYANPSYIPQNTQDASALMSAVADGVSRDFIQSIRDGYDNAIIPAGGIGRIISMDLSGISNQMYLNQYNRSGGSSVFVDNNTTALSTISQSLGNRTSTTGSYPLSLFVYTPTANSYTATDPISDPLASFSFTTNLTVSDMFIGSVVFSQPLSNPSFKPLYTSLIGGDLKNGGFIEGTEQVGNIGSTNNNLGVSPTSLELKLEFSGSDVGSFDFYASNISSSTIPIGSIATMIPNPGISYTDLYSKLIQKSNPVNNVSNLQFSTHFSYILDGKGVLYNSDMIGKSGGYWGTTDTLGNQVGIKIIGPISSNSISSIVNGQFDNSTTIFGGLSRAEVHNSMRQSIALATRNMRLTPISNIVNDITNPSLGMGASGARIDLSSIASIIRIEKTGGNVTLALTSGVSGKRTLVVKGANLYITKNMYYDLTNKNSILGVVVQKDDAGNGGNLYIDPSVTNIVGTYIIDGSIMSYDSTGEIGVGNIAKLKNQLYIYGSIVSENTIGGSRMSPLRCPSLLNGSCSTTSEAQKYDLNYLRRYYLYGGQPFGNGKVVGDGNCNIVSCTGFVANLIQKFTTPMEDLAKYPVIIEYNQLLRTNPPIGFEQSKE